VEGKRIIGYIAVGKKRVPPLNEQQRAEVSAKPSSRDEEVLAIHKERAAAIEEKEPMGPQHTASGCRRIIMRQPSQSFTNTVKSSSNQNTSFSFLIDEKASMDMECTEEKTLPPSSSVYTLHIALENRTASNMEENKQVCFSIKWVNALGKELETTSSLGLLLEGKLP
jgi:hypothetical protein